MDQRATKRTKPKGASNPRLDALRLDHEDEWLRSKVCFSGDYSVTTLSPQVLIHRYLLGAKLGEVVDHVNGNRLDNRKENLRLVSRAVNVLNSASVRARCGYRGVCPESNGPRWRARITFGGKEIHLGTYETPEEANRARLLREKELYGVQPQRLTAFLEAGIEVEDVAA